MSKSNIKLKPDHIIYAVLDLETGMDTIEALLGERPIFGGQHPGKGSHNALLSLGEDVYLEVIASDPAQPEPATARSFGLDKLTEARLATWAARTTDIEATIQQAKAAGYDPGDMVAGGRTRDDGLRLTWRNATRPEAMKGETPPGDWLIPFIIDWGDTPHPAATTPGQSRLVSLQATHPDPDLIQGMLQALGLDLVVTQGDEPALIATIDSPNGRVVLR
jgi:hypothetical protein